MLHKKLSVRYSQHSEMPGDIPPAGIGGFRETRATRRGWQAKAAQDAAGESGDHVALKPIASTPGAVRSGFLLKDSRPARYRFSAGVGGSFMTPISPSPSCGCLKRSTPPRSRHRDPAADCRPLVTPRVPETSKGSAIFR